MPADRQAFTPPDGPLASHWPSITRATVVPDDAARWAAAKDKTRRLDGSDPRRAAHGSPPADRPRPAPGLAP